MAAFTRMKDRALIYLSLALSGASLGYAAWVHHQGCQALAMRALRQRETELVRHLAPKMDIIYRDMLADPSRIPKSPKTLEELLDPLVTLLDQIGDPDGGHTNKPTAK